MTSIMCPHLVMFVWVWDACMFYIFIKKPGNIIFVQHNHAHCIEKAKTGGRGAWLNTSNSCCLHLSAVRIEKPQQLQKLPWKSAIYKWKHTLKLILKFIFIKCMLQVPSFEKNIDCSSWPKSNRNKEWNEKAKCSRKHKNDLLLP